GYVLQSSKRARQLALNNERLRPDYEKLLGLYQRLAAAYALPVAQQAGVDSLHGAIRDLEKSLRRRSADLAMAWEQPDWQAVCTALQDHELAIEFVHYQQHTPWPTDTTIYGALVLLPGIAAPHYVPLCTEAALRSVLQTEEGSAISPTELYAPTGRGAQLYELLWKPLATALAALADSPRTVYYANSGLLHRVQWAAIPSPDGQVLGANWQLHQLSSTRQLVDSPKADKQHTPATALLYGGIDYQLDTTSSLASLDANASLLVLTDGAQLRGFLELTGWSPLPWTEVEVSLASDALQASGYTTEIQLGKQATEQWLKQRLDPQQVQPGPAILHLATHAYFTPEAQSDGENSFVRSRNPLIRSGLILAGANYAWRSGHPWQAGQEDGILTAYELSQLDLSDTELVILSACETGLGRITDYEGVFGLQRACKIAGARYLIMSLWQIPDFQTQAFLSAFYQFYLQDKLSVPAAFQAAQSLMRQQFGQVSDWAGLILVE
ncbi:MAG: CHAT domain-containing protein, partial [Bacteroidetes bacterium]